MKPERRTHRKIRPVDLAILWLAAAVWSFLIVRFWLDKRWLALPIAVLVGGVPVMLIFLVVRWRSTHELTRRRMLANQCLKCGYDRSGLAPGVVCPECGAASA